MRGGKRRGAGRPKGALNEKTKRIKAIAEKATIEGITPLEVMLRAMRAQWDVAAPNGTVTDTAAALVAAKMANDAAPYCHPRLCSINHSGEIGRKRDPSELSDEELAAIAGGGGGGDALAADGAKDVSRLH